MKNSLYSLIGFIVLPFIWEANTINLTSLADKEVIVTTSDELMSLIHLDTTSLKQVTLARKVEGEIILENLEATFDGTPKSAAIKTMPEGLSTLSLYVKDGIIYQQAPSEKGVYELIVVINDRSSEATTISEKFIIR